METSVRNQNKNPVLRTGFSGSLRKLSLTSFVSQCEQVRACTPCKTVLGRTGGSLWLANTKASVCDEAKLFFLFKISKKNSLNSGSLLWRQPAATELWFANRWGSGLPGRPQRAPVGECPGFRPCCRGREPGPGRVQAMLGAGRCWGPSRGRDGSVPVPFPVAPTGWRPSTAHPPPPRPPIGCAGASPWQRAGNWSCGPPPPSLHPLLHRLGVPQTLPFCPFSALPGPCPGGSEAAGKHPRVSG